MKKIALILASAIIVLSSCVKDEDILPITNFDAQEHLKSEEANKIAEEVNSIIVKDYEEDGASRMAENNTTPYLPNCVTRTIISDGTNHSVEFDFGTTGCTMPNGNVITGKILYTYVGDILASTKTITYELINFTFNDKQVAGTDIINHVRENTNGNPQSTIHVDFFITWPEGLTATRTGTITREWIEGSNTLLVWADDVFLVSGNWNTVFSTGNTYTANITTRLRRALTCWYFESGSINFNYSGLQFTGDYGDGTCDNNATLTFTDGTVIDILL